MKIIDLKEKQNKKEIELALKFYYDLKKLYIDDNDFENSHYGYVVQKFFEEEIKIGHLKNTIPISDLFKDK